VNRGNKVCAIVGMLFSATAFIMTLSFKQFQNVPVGPEFVPRYLAAGLFICSLVLLIQQRKNLDKRPSPLPGLRDIGMQRLIKGAVLTLVYALLWEPVGFIIITPIATFVLMHILGQRRYLAMAIFSVGAMVSVFVTFRFFLNVEMPLGLLDGLL